ncbi:APC family permease [Streptomyces sp. NPDC004752]
MDTKHHHPADPAGPGTDTAVQKAKLRKHFGRSDIFFFLVCTLVGVDGLGTLATQGGAGFSWMLICVAVFAVPSAMLLAELGAAWTDEGGAYIWVRTAFGQLPAALANVFYWVSNPVWVGGTLVGTAIGGIGVFFGDDSNWSRPATYAFGLAFIWTGVLLAVYSFRVGKWIATIGAVARFALLGTFTLVVFAYGLKHGFHGPGIGDYLPTYPSFVLLVPLILFSLVGFELPSSAGDEMKDASRDVPSGIAKSVVAATVLYGLPVLGILLVLPSSQATGLAGFPDAFRQALTAVGGHVSTAPDGTMTAHLSGLGTVVGWLMGLLVVVVAFTSGLVWLMGSDRTLAVSCYDGAGPKALGVFSERFGTPARVNLLSGLVSTAVLVAGEQITAGNAYKFFEVGMNLAVSTTLISYLCIFPAAWRLRRAQPQQPRPYRAPLVAFLTVLSMSIAAFCTVQIFFPGLGVHWFGDDFRPDGWAVHEKWTYLLTELVPVTAFVLLGVVFWAVGRRRTST